ncbi:hypothetical protein BC829DRAFT_290428 [Chytridium lagenaria]|nr:hypothetical protein BC829DRAFT_290428 [Chytridium lagenaria]
MSSSPSTTFGRHGSYMDVMNSPPAKRGRSGKASVPNLVSYAPAPSSSMFSMPSPFTSPVISRMYVTPIPGKDVRLSVKCVDGVPQMRERSPMRNWQDGMIQNSESYNVPNDFWDADGDVDMLRSGDIETLCSFESYEFSRSYASADIKTIVADDNVPNLEPTIMDKVYEGLFGHELHEAPPCRASDDFQFVANSSITGFSPVDVSGVSGWYGFNAYQHRGF